MKKFLAKYWLVVAGLFVTMLVLSSTQQAVAAPQWRAQAQADATILVVRAYYSDSSQIDFVAARRDMWEVEWNRAEQYVVLDTTAAERAELEAAGFRLETDMAETTAFNQALARFSGLDVTSAAATAGISGYSCYRTVEETYATAAGLATAHPELASVIDIGDSWAKSVNSADGYDLQVLRLTNSAIAGPKPQIFIMSSVHAREYTPAELNTRFAEYLVNNYGVDADATWILDYNEVHLLLMANPDGRKQAENGQFWRKNTNAAYCGGVSTYVSGSQHGGADLNRNFSYLWNSCTAAQNCSSNEMCFATYRGTSAGSEPEVQAIQSYLLNHFPDNRAAGLTAAAPSDASGIFLDVHSYSELVLWPWGSEGDTANAAAFRTLGRKFADFNDYMPQRSDELYATDGTTIDFAYGELGLAAFTFELGTTFFQSCADFENTIYPDNLQALIYAAKVARAPYQLPAGPDMTNLSLSAAVVGAADTVTIRANADDTGYSANNGAEAVQAIAGAEYYLDIPPWESGATAIAMNATDSSFNSTVEEVTGTLDTTGLALGTHTIYTRAQDADGNWGPVSAIFVTVSATPPATTTIFEDDFESDAGWSPDPNGADTASTGAWERAAPQQTTQSGVIIQRNDPVSGSNSLVTTAAAGVSAGSNDVDGGVTTIQSPPIDLPPDATITLTFWYNLAHANNATTADYFQTAVVTDGGTDIVYTELGAATTQAGAWQEVTLDLSSYAGQTIRLLFAAADLDSGSLLEAQVDDVSITAATTPSLPALTGLSFAPASPGIVPGETVLLTARVVPPTPGVTVSFSVDAGSGELAAATAVTDANGEASVSYTGSATTGIDRVDASVNAGAFVDAAYLFVAAGSGNTQQEYATGDPHTTGELATHGVTITKQGSGVPWQGVAQLNADPCPTSTTAITAASPLVDILLEDVADVTSLDVIIGYTNEEAEAQHNLYWCNAGEWMAISGATVDIANNQMRFSISAATAPSLSQLEGTPFVVSRNGSLPVTLAWFLAEAGEEGIDFRWQTATETGSAGFNLLAANDPAGPHTKLNVELIPSQVIDSTEPTEYRYLAIPLGWMTATTHFYVEEISLDNVSTVMGPFQLGREYGAFIDGDRIDSNPIDGGEQPPHTIYLPLVTSR